MKEINVLTEMIDDLRCTLEPFEVLDNLKELQMLITQKPELVKEIIEDAISRAEETCKDENICPECGEPLEYEEDSTSHPYGEGFAREYFSFAVCPRCSFTTR